MATIIIKRSDNYNKARNYQIFLDGEKIGTISNGQTKKFETTTGQHTLVTKIDLWSSSKVSLVLHDADEKTFTVSGFKNGNFMLLIAAGIFGFDFISRNLFHNDYGIMLIIPALLLFVYYLTLGQKTYLTLTET
jgi:hypothetical protein